MDKGEKILWAPDQQIWQLQFSVKTGADMLLGKASCIVHEESRPRPLLDLKAV